jgi:multiple sugar transport system substrate-binding protein
MRATAAVYESLNPDVRVIWEARSITDFAYARLDSLVTDYDLILIDHPHVGEANMPRTLLALDEWLPASYLDDQARSSVGPSYKSYSWQEHQWALPVDAAAQVAAYRRDLLAGAGCALPVSWAGVIELARRLPEKLRIALPLLPIDAACSLLTIGVNLDGPTFWERGRGYNEIVLHQAVRLLAQLAELVDPVSFELNPPQMLAQMAGSDRIAYAPLLFGYSNYARPGFARHVVSFTDIPSSSAEPRGAVLGGVGLAVSRLTSNPQTAVDYAAYVASAEVQRGVYFTSGGQPGHDSAWVDPDVNRESDNFFLDTRRTLEGSYLRPRLAEDREFVELQPLVGEILWKGLSSRRSVETMVSRILKHSTSLG